MIHYRFYLRPTTSPTYYNLYHHLENRGWSSTRLPCRAQFSEKQFEFNLAAAEQLEFKHQLATLIANDNLVSMPETYIINDSNWGAVLAAVKAKYDESGIWILKPALLNNGQHIKIFEQLQHIEKHYISGNRLGGEHVLQAYIKSPHLLRGHKYSIRMFIILTNFDGAHIYPHGYLNVARQPYCDDDFSDLRIHLTNEHLQGEESNTIQIPTQRLALFSSLYPQIKSLTSAVVGALRKIKPEAFRCTKDRALAIFGFDFIADDEMRVWLLEANHGPCFPISRDHVLQHYLYDDFWKAFIVSFVVPIATQQLPENIDYQQFERLI